MSIDPGQFGGATRLRVHLDSHAHGVIVARVVGALDLATTAMLDAELSLAFAAGPCRLLVLDLAGVEYLDSTGLRALWTIRQSMRELRGSLVLRRPSAAVLHVLESAGLTAMFEVA